MSMIQNARKKVYIAGPYRVPDPRINTHRAIEWGEEVWKMGFIPFVPHLTYLWDGVCRHPEADWLAYDLHWLRDCHAVLRIPGFSVGADNEVDEAELLGIPVFYSLAELRAWSYVASEQPERKTVSMQANEIVSGDRGADYGHPIDDFTKTGKIWAAILGLPQVTPEQVALCMVGIKISRECHKPKRDNLIDGCGYFQTIELIQHERARRAKAAEN